MERSRRFAAVLATAAALTLSNAGAQSWPARPIKLLVAGAPGSVPDTLARPIAERLAASLGQPVVIDNRPGASGMIAMGALVKSAPDGHTLALATMSQAVFNSYLFSNLPYDPIRDLEPVGLLATGAMVVVAHPSFPARSFEALVAMAKERPSTVFVGIPGNGSPPHIVALLLMRAASIQLVMVPHRTGPEGLANVLSGEVPVFIDAPSIVLPHARSGKLNALAVTGRHREAALPDVPTLAESGLVDARGEAWIGLVAPTGTRREIVHQLNRELGGVLATPDVQRLLAAVGFQARVATPEEFRDLIREEHARWSVVIKEAGLKLE